MRRGEVKRQWRQRRGNKLCRSTAFPRDSFSNSFILSKRHCRVFPVFFFTSQMSCSANAHVGQNSGKSGVNAKYAAIVRRLAEAESSTSQERDCRRRHRLVYSDQRFLSLQLASLRDSSLLSRLASSAEVHTNSDEPLIIPRFAKCRHTSGEVSGSAPGQGVGARTEPPGRVWLGAVQGLNETNLRRV